MVDMKKKQFLIERGIRISVKTCLFSPISWRLGSCLDLHSRLVSGSRIAKSMRIADSCGRKPILLKIFYRNNEH